MSSRYLGDTIKRWTDIHRSDLGEGINPYLSGGQVITGSLKVDVCNLTCTCACVNSHFNYQIDNNSNSTTWHLRDIWWAATHQNQDCWRLDTSSVKAAEVAWNKSFACRTWPSFGHLCSSFSVAYRQKESSSETACVRCGISTRSVKQVCSDRAAGATARPTNNAYLDQVCCQLGCLFEKGT